MQRQSFQNVILHAGRNGLNGDQGGSIIMNEQRGKYKCMGITRRSDIPDPDFHRIKI